MPAKAGGRWAWGSNFSLSVGKEFRARSGASSASSLPLFLPLSPSLTPASPMEFENLNIVQEPGHRRDGEPGRRGPDQGGAAARAGRGGLPAGQDQGKRLHYTALLHCAMYCTALHRTAFCRVLPLCTAACAAAAGELCAVPWAQSVLHIYICCEAMPSMLPG